MRQVRLTRVCSKHDNLRDDVIDGEQLAVPEVGKRYVLYAEPRDGGNVRIIRTTPVVSLAFAPEYLEFKTENSTYRLEDLD